MPAPRNHEENLELVCAVCTNLNGYKAKRPVVDKDTELIRKHVFPGFCKNNIWLPQGICIRCALDLRELDQQEYGGAGDENKPAKRKRNIKLRDTITIFYFRSVISTHYENILRENILAYYL